MESRQSCYIGLFVLSYVAFLIIRSNVTSYTLIFSLVQWSTGKHFFLLILSFSGWVRLSVRSQCWNILHCHINACKTKKLWYCLATWAPCINSGNFCNTFNKYYYACSWQYYEISFLRFVRRNVCISQKNAWKIHQSGRWFRGLKIKTFKQFLSATK